MKLNRLQVENFLKDAYGYTEQDFVDTEEWDTSELIEYMVDDVYELIGYYS